MTGEPIDILVFGKIPKWLADTTRSDIVVRRQPDFDLDGLVRQPFASSPFIWIESNVSADVCLRLLASGAEDVWCAKDPNVAQIALAGIDKVRERRRLCAELADAFGLVGCSPATRRLREQIAEACLLADVPVLLLGATGSGKMHAARALHAIDPLRREEPAPTLDCGTAGDAIFASDLFGHLRGAFTGAEKSRDGAIVTAARGYLILDEIGELPARLQSALLGVLQEMQFKPVGSDRDYPVRCRIVSLTNRPLPQLVEAGEFRRDLYHRLDGITIRVPSLDERVDDIPAIFQSIASRHAEREIEVAPAVGELLCAHAFPGNVRQLEMAARIAVARRADPERIRPGDLPGWLKRSAPACPEPSAPALIRQLLADEAGLDEIVAAFSAEAVRLKLDQLRARYPLERRTALVRRAARHLKVSERTVYNRLNGLAPT